jgi:hypothetical protein
MLDFIKLRIDNQELINRVFLHPDFVKCKPKNNYYYSKYQKEIEKKLQLDFHKINDFNEFDYVDVCISPHYHFNNYLHNGNDLTPENCIKSIFEILDYLQIKSYELNELKVVNLEVGVNIIPETDVKELINGIYYSKKTPFMVYNLEHPYYKRTEKGSEYIIIKTYAKGLQFQDQSQLGIDINTFRFEVKTKKHRKIKSLGITTAKDLLNIAKYPRLAEEVINEWQNVLLINLTPDLANLRREDVQFIKQSVKFDFWNDLITNKHRNTIRNNKNKYYNILKGKNNLHHLIKLQIIDKIYQLLNCANSPQETPINKGILKTKETALNTINGENAQLEQTNRQCLVTGLRIDMQKKNSVYLSNTGLLWYYKNDIKTFLQLQNRFLTSDKRKLKIIEQIYYIAHNIRNTKTNEYHNRNKFVERNYNVNQLQFTFT